MKELETMALKQLFIERKLVIRFTRVIHGIQSHSYNATIVRWKRRGNVCSYEAARELASPPKPAKATHMREKCYASMATPSRNIQLLHN